MNYDPVRLAAAKRYAAADKSDPFAMGRILCHMRNGVCGYRPIEDFPWMDQHNPRRMGVLRTQSEDAFYSADEHTETRVTAEGNEYPVVVYRNQVRP